MTARGRVWDWGAGFRGDALVEAWAAAIEAIYRIGSWQHDEDALGLPRHRRRRDPATWPEECPQGCHREFDSLPASQAPLARHRYHRTEPCEMALALARAYEATRRPGWNGWPYAEQGCGCGIGGYDGPPLRRFRQRHARAGTAPCAESVEMSRAYQRQGERLRRRGQSGDRTRALARARYRRRQEDTGNTPSARVPTPERVGDNGCACGAIDHAGPTSKWAQWHTYRGTEPCDVAARLRNEARRR